MGPQPRELPLPAEIAMACEAGSFAAGRGLTMPV
jgi:hypothetical protein